MNIDPKGRLASRGELYNVASANCALLFLAVLAANAQENWVTVYAMACSMGMSVFYGIKARRADQPDARRAALAGILDAARRSRLTTEAPEPPLSTEEASEEHRRLLADLQSQLIQLRKKVEGV